MAGKKQKVNRYEDQMRECGKIFKKYNIKNVKDLRKFIIKKHPDKVENFDQLPKKEQNEIKTILGCFGDKDAVFDRFMDVSSLRSSSPSSASSARSRSSPGPVDESSVFYEDEGTTGIPHGEQYGEIHPEKINYPDVKRAGVYNEKRYDCVRQRTNFSHINPRSMKFDHRKYLSPQELQEQLAPVMNVALELGASPKINALFNKIDELDRQDMEKHGKKFKHFIFSDVKKMGYGAKIIAAAMIARGYSLAIGYRRGKVDVLDNRDHPRDMKDKVFGLLSSTAMYNRPTTQKLRNKILGVFNERPENIHGENMRFIVLDSGFKEGIDLFDVKYCHLFEMPSNIADMKQSVGRGTRTCGQKGLQFVPGKGIKLNVITYDLDLSNIHDTHFGKYKNAFELVLAYSNINLDLMKFSQEINTIAINSAIDFELNYNINTLGKKKTEARGGEPLMLQLGGIRKNASVFDCARSEASCGRRANKKMPFTNSEMEIIYRSLGFKMPKTFQDTKRKFLCQQVLKVPEFCEELKIYQTTPGIMEVYIQRLEKYRLPGKKRGRKPKKKPAADDTGMKYPAEKYQMIVYNQEGTPTKVSGSSTSGLKASDFENEEEEQNNILALIDRVRSQAGSRPHASRSTTKTRKSSKTKSGSASGPGVALGKARTKFKTMKQARRYIRENFGEFKWEKPAIEDMCNKKRDDGGSKPKKPYTVLNLHESQNFSRFYFTPSSPYKGLLLWHSVGTGKTCASVATATTTFEKMGYTILFVTRTTLKADIWKNVFKMVCSDDIKEKIARGKEPGKNLSTNKRRLLSKQWIEPLSYKQFTNALRGGNKYTRELVKRNGRADPLRKTLVILDEAHKLYGGDLKASEKPDVDAIEKSLNKSYKTSGDNSVKVLLMTATPITNDGMELIKLMNLLIENKKDRFPSEYNDFKRKYLNDDGSFRSQKDKQKVAFKMMPYISYLNRENDPRQFAVPEFTNVVAEVPPDLNIEDYHELVRRENPDLIKLATQGENVDKYEERLEQIGEKLEEQEQALEGHKDDISAMDDRLRSLREEKKESKGKEYKDHRAYLADVIRGIMDEKRDKRSDMKEIRSRISTLKRKKRETARNIKQIGKQRTKAAKQITKRIKKMRKDFMPYSIPQMLDKKCKVDVIGERRNTPLNRRRFPSPKTRKSGRSSGSRRTRKSSSRRTSLDSSF
jgi:hypothetical protein